jgi:hypothetical protein
VSALVRAVAARGATAVRPLALPLAAYLVITLAVPAAGGAVTQAAFWRHAVWVLCGCLAVLVLSAAAQVVWARARGRLAARGPAGGAP